MSKTYIATGSKLKNITDPNLSFPHPAGTPVYLVQLAKDNKWGRYLFKHYFRSLLFFKTSEKHYNRTLKLLDECRDIKLDRTNTRPVDKSLRNRLELKSISYLIFLKLGFEYLLPDMMIVINNVRERKYKQARIDWESKENLSDKIKTLTDSLDIKVKIPEILVTLFKRRDIVEHPTHNRTYNTSGQGWKNVHLAWVLSGEIEGSFEKIAEYVNIIFAAYDKFDKDNQIPGTISVSRGIRSLDQSKKPIKKTG